MDLRRPDRPSDRLALALRGPHGGRATLLLTRGMHPKNVSEMLGHSTITLTLDTYSHLIPALHEQAAATMDRMLGS